MKVEKDLDMQEVEGEVNVKTEKGRGSEEEECIFIEYEGRMYSEEEEREEYIDTKGERDVDIKEEVSYRIQYNVL
jgi:hypothetical protein